jgi:hypothetical protein
MQAMPNDERLPKQHGALFSVAVYVVVMLPKVLLLLWWWWVGGWVGELTVFSAACVVQSGGSGRPFALVHAVSPARPISCLTTWTRRC